MRIGMRTGRRPRDALCTQATAAEELAVSAHATARALQRLRCQVSARAALHAEYSQAGD
jgi:hypothetical protein